jgi:PPOX class probable F420-dependent enzyme
MTASLSNPARDRDAAAQLAATRQRSETVTEANPTSFTEKSRKLLDAKSFATVATLNPDGSPQTSVVWIKRDHDHVLFSTTTSRRKARNLARDPRISLSIFDLENPYYSVEIRGTAELIDDPDRTLPKELSRKYLGEDPPDEPAEVIRVIVRVTPHRIREFSP